MYIWWRYFTCSELAPPDIHRYIDIYLYGVCGVNPSGSKGKVILIRPPLRPRVDRGNRGKLPFVVRTVAAPPSIVVQCGVGVGSSCGRLWYCSCHVVCLVLFLWCVCDVLLCLQFVSLIQTTGRNRSRFNPTYL